MTGSEVTPLTAAAFGDDPGCWPLPAASTPLDHWLRAVAAGGQGRYGCARAELATLRRTAPSGPLASLAHSTQASFLRQLGGHALARGWDGRARALAGTDVEATVDALIGLAADALGVRRFTASAALLRGAREILDSAGAAPDRLPLRLEWVSAELAMVRGDGSAAVGHAERGRELAAMSQSWRHRVKTAVVLAAALCSAGDVTRARTVADEAFVTAGRAGLMPLQWAVASLLVDIGSHSLTADQLRAVRDGCALELQRRGGVWHR
ncbi:MAG: hypothetical protein JO152_08105 [Mycobacteriaceae bacterium]|nr:hypothetical protein [Mycobacteriaceae bacterium]